MSSKLRKLIAHYEAEKRQLQALIAEFVDEKDYAMAHRHAKALRMVEEKLLTYHKLADPLHETKEFRRKNIESLKKKIEAGIPQRQLGYYLERLLQEQQSLDELSRVVEATPGEPRQTTLQKTLLKLLDGKIEKFTLVIDEAQRLYCTIHLVRRTLIITFPQIRRLVNA
ncbi:MAG TPA: hypothetical protein VF690_14805 [Hymenobacter sp.]